MTNPQDVIDFFNKYPFLWPEWTDKDDKLVEVALDPPDEDD